MCDICHPRSERPGWITAYFAALNDRFRETTMHRRDSLIGLIEACRRTSLHQHQAASSALPPSNQTRMLQSERKAAFGKPASWICPRSNDGIGP